MMARGFRRPGGAFEGEEERWQPVVGFEELYAVSSHGRVKSLRRTHHVTPTSKRRPYERQLQNRILKAQPNNGSPIVTLWRDRQRVQISVPRLMAEAFGR